MKSLDKELEDITNKYKNIYLKSKKSEDKIEEGFSYLQKPPAEWRSSKSFNDSLFFIFTSGTTGLPKAGKNKFFIY
jgi:acyl-coenzyme A synthetase/AMP-(fatty) acid ligase